MAFLPRLIYISIYLLLFYNSYGVLQKINALIPQMGRERENALRGATHVRRKLRPLIARFWPDGAALSAKSPYTPARRLSWANPVPGAFSRGSPSLWTRSFAYSCLVFAEQRYYVTERQESQWVSHQFSVRNWRWD